MANISQILSTPLSYRTYRYKITHIIIAINIIIFIFSQFIRGTHGLLAMNPILFLQGRYWTVVTYMFDHASFSHLFFNMLGLFFFGSVVERIWGSNEFILIYGVIGMLAGIFSLIVYLMIGYNNAFLLGASGVVYGILLIFACMFPYQRIYVFGIFPITAKVLMLVFIGIQLISVTTQRGGGVAYFTHISGIAIAWIYLLVRQNINPYRKLLGK